jgi:hypothetical protein
MKARDDMLEKDGRKKQGLLNVWKCFMLFESSNYEAWQHFCPLV